MPIKRNNLNALYSAMDSLNINKKDKQKSYEVEGLFKPKMGADGKFTVVLRFLPAHPDEEIPWIENRSHMFQLANGSWFGCDCAKKWNEPCPICDYNAKIWTKYGRTDEARMRVKDKWKPKFYSNVYIVKNPNAPETEGRVYRFEYGRAIMKFIQDAMADKDDAELGVIPGINPFSWWGPNDKAVLDGEDKAGANFVWEGIKGSNGPNYSTSHFSNPRRMCKLGQDGKLVEMTDAELDVVESQLYTLKDIEKQKDQMRSYEDILKFYKTKAGEDLFAEFEDGTDYTATVNTNKTVDADDEGMFSAPAPKKTVQAPVEEPAEEPVFEASFETPKTTSVSSPVQEAEDEDDFFAKLANG